MAQTVLVVDFPERRFLVPLTLLALSGKRDRLLLKAD